MSRVRPETLLFVLLLTVPLVVGVAGVAAFLLMRAGFGFLIWGAVPFVASLLAVAGLSFVLSRAARASRDQSPEEPRRGRDGV
ncbi:MAG TPA: hypothetical protein VFY59_13120 [Rubrobacter sp.]|jgi:hypothetical protein|nr:hypothetical protein [Rubrobacter sp.]HYQ85481.1 hypothetical protein [Rubrobacter sp.]